MKIVISAMGKREDSILDKRFGRCEYFIIYDTETKEKYAVNNEAVRSNQGAGIAAATQVIEERANVVITGNLGPNSFKVLEKSGIKAFQSEEIRVSTVIERFQKNELSPIMMAGADHQGMHG